MTVTQHGQSYVEDSNFREDCDATGDLPETIRQ